MGGGLRSFAPGRDLLSSGSRSGSVRATVLCDGPQAPPPARSPDRNGRPETRAAQNPPRSARPMPPDPRGCTFGSRGPSISRNRAGQRRPRHESIVPVQPRVRAQQRAAQISSVSRSPPSVASCSSRLLVGRVGTRLQIRAILRSARGRDDQDARRILEHPRQFERDPRAHAVPEEGVGFIACTDGSPRASASISSGMLSMGGSAARLSRPGSSTGQTSTPSIDQPR